MNSQPILPRSYYANSIKSFIQEDETRIFGALASRHAFALDELQKNSWIAEIKILKSSMAKLRRGYLFLEYAIPRMGKRVDAIVLENGCIYILEFKLGAHEYNSDAIDQVLDYALDLKNFHEKSHSAPIVPILVATEAKDVKTELLAYDDNIFAPIKANQNSLQAVLRKVRQCIPQFDLDPIEWASSIYNPTPTIVEAAQALYENHSVAEISRCDASGVELQQTSDTIAEIIRESKANHWKTICFITGVPGSGKTLVGLNIANQKLGDSAEENAVFLSGNGPLVRVLQEALARNQVACRKDDGSPISKRIALSKTKAFIQNIHHFRDDALSNQAAPVNRVVIFDEAQRAWTKEQLAAFMKVKKGIFDFQVSEPEFLIQVMDRHTDWAVIVCLIGGGQEINTGEAGLLEWFKAIQIHFPHWNVFVSERLSDVEYTQGEDLYRYIAPEKLTFRPYLHLAVSVRSFRSENVSNWVKAVLDQAAAGPQELYQKVCREYPIVLTRDLEQARRWLKEKARGTERCGLVASSGSYRLKAEGINVKAQIDVENWFLNGKSDVRSSYYLEDVATEFDIQGLELDWICVAWDADLRFGEQGWEYWNFKGTKWQRVKDEARRMYLKNAYRVLLTRARQGMVIFVPGGSEADPTRMPEYYDTLYGYLRSVGVEEIGR